MRLVATAIPLPPPPAPKHDWLRRFSPRNADRLEKWHRFLINYKPAPTPDPSQPTPKDLPGLMLSPEAYPVELQDWYRRELAAFGFSSPNEVIPPTPGGLSS